jgi:hypothetical protein
MSLRLRRLRDRLRDATSGPVSRLPISVPDLRPLFDGRAGLVEIGNTLGPALTPPSSRFLRPGCSQHAPRSSHHSERFCAAYHATLMINDYA